MIKTILQQIGQEIIDTLPHGAINKIAEEHGYSRQTIAKMLKGETGQENVVNEVLSSAIEILDTNSRLQTDLASKIKKELQVSSTAA